MAILRLDGDATGAVRATEDVRKGMAKVAEETEKVEGKTKDAGKAQEESFGANAMRHIGTYITGLLGVQKGIELVVGGFREVERQGQQAADAVMASLGQIAQLQLVSQTPEEFARNLATSRELIARGIVGPTERGQAYGIVAQMQRAGLTAQEQALLIGIADQERIAGRQVGEFALNIRAYQEAFGPQAGTFGDVTAKVMAAGRISRQSPEEIALQVTRYAEQAKEAGMTDIQALAAATTIARTSPNVRMAASRAQKYFEEGEPFVGAQAELYARTLRDIQGAPRRGIGPSLIPTDPGLAAAKVREDIEGQAALAWDRIGEKESLFQALRSAAATRELQRAGPGAYYLSQMLGGIFNLSQTEESVFRATLASPLSRRRLAAEQPELLGRLEDYMRRVAESNERMERPAPSGRQE